MGLESIAIWLLIGAIAGWLAGLIMKRDDFGIVGNIILGIIGSLIGGWLFGSFMLGSAGGFVGAVLSATIGAVVLIFVVRLVRRTA